MVGADCQVALMSVVYFSLCFSGKLYTIVSFKVQEPWGVSKYDLFVTTVTGCYSAVRNR